MPKVNPYDKTTQARRIELKTRELVAIEKLAEAVARCSVESQKTNDILVSIFKMLQVSVQQSELVNQGIHGISTIELPPEVKKTAFLSEHDKENIRENWSKIDVKEDRNGNPLGIEVDEEAMEKARKRIRQRLGIDVPNFSDLTDAEKRKLYDGIPCPDDLEKFRNDKSNWTSLVEGDKPDTSCDSTIAQVLQDEAIQPPSPTSSDGKEEEDMPLLSTLKDDEARELGIALKTKRKTPRKMYVEKEYVATQESSPLQFTIDDLEGIVKPQDRVDAREALIKLQLSDLQEEVKEAIEAQNK